MLSLLLSKVVRASPVPPGAAQERAAVISLIRPSHRGCDWTLTVLARRPGNLVVVLGLHCEEAGVSTPVRHQGVVAAVLDDTAVLEHDDLVGHTNRGETVGD